jgi:hypothetical protein
LHPRGKTKTIYFGRGILKEFLARGNAKHTHLAVGNDILILIIKMENNIIFNKNLLISLFYRISN